MANIAEEFAGRIRAPGARRRSSGTRLGRCQTLWPGCLWRTAMMHSSRYARRSLRNIPFALHARALATYQKFLKEAETSSERLRIRLSMGEVGGQHIVEDVKEELNKWPSGKIGDDERPLMKSALELVRQADPYWVSQWVAERIVNGSPLFGYWEMFISKIDRYFREALFKRISSEE